MRVLITTPPGIGHIFPAVPTAWALRAAGHDVILATSSNHELASNAGLQVVDTAPGVDFYAVFGGFMAEHGGSFGEEPDAQEPAGGGTDAGIELAARMFAVVGSKFTDETVRLVRHWQPDLVLHTALDAVGPLAAAVAGVPSVVHSIGIAQPSALWTRLAHHFTGEYERIGVSSPTPAAVLDVSPPSLRAPDSDGWSMRYVPYNGGAVLPDWLREPRRRPRVTVTLGSVVPRMAGVGALRPFVAAAGTVDADVVITLGGADPADFGELPDNVRLLDWVPLGALLAASDAVIHHGGSGSTLTALDAGLPQLVMPHGADQYLNAELLAKAGAGAMVRPTDLDADRLGELLDGTSMRAAAQAVSAEMAGQPTPAELVPDIIALAR
jgi:UDP:flavonoid glycosyltransferase YjiC (YdhE family)